MNSVKIYTDFYSALFLLEGIYLKYPMFIILIILTHSIDISVLSSRCLCSYVLALDMELSGRWETELCSPVELIGGSLCQSNLDLWFENYMTFAFAIIICQFDLNFISVIVWWVFFWFFKNHCLVRVTRFSLDRCVGVKLIWTCWLKIFSGPNVLGFSLHVFLEGDTQPQERLINQSLGENILLAQGRVSTLVSEHCVLCTTLPLEGRRHLLRFWQGCYSVSAQHSCPASGCWCGVVPSWALEAFTHYDTMIFNPFSVALKPLHILYYLHLSSVLPVSYHWKLNQLCYVLSSVCGIFIYSLLIMWNSVW